MEHEVAKLYNEAQEECQAKNSNHPKHESIKFINSLAACVFPLPQWLCFNNSIRPHLLWKERKPLPFESKSHCAPRFAMAPDTTTLVKPNRCTFATNASWTARGLLVSSLFRIVHEIWYIHLTPSFVVVLSSQCNLIHNPKHQQSRSVLLALCSHLPFWSQACRSFQAKTLLRVLMSEPKFAPYTGLSANRWRKGSQSSALVVQCTWSALRSIYKERGLLW